MSLNDVLETNGRSRVHGVNVGFVKEGSGNRNSGRNMDFGGLLELALMTSIDVPLHIAVKSGAPKVIEKGVLSRVNALVA